MSSKFKKINKVIVANAENKPKLGFINPEILILILEFLGPLLENCFSPDSADQVQEYIWKRYDSENNQGRYGGYKKSLVKRVTRNTKVAARKANTRLTWAESRELAVATLDTLRTEASTTLSEAIDVE